MSCNGKQTYESKIKTNFGISYVSVRRIISEIERENQKPYDDDDEEDEGLLYMRNF